MVQLCSFSSYLLTCGRSSPEPALLLLVLPALEQSQQLRKFHVKLLMQEQNFRVRQDCPVSRQGAGTALPFTPAVPPVAPSELHGTPETPTRAITSQDGALQISRDQQELVSLHWKSLPEYAREEATEAQC